MMDWWNTYAESNTKDFKDWVGDAKAATKVYLRSYIKEAGYTSCLDCGCGLCDNYKGFREEGYGISYIGIDTCKHFVKLGVDAGITVFNQSIEDIRFPDNFFDVVYTRHALEHLSDFKKALSEMLRVAAEEVIVVFFKKPGDALNCASIDVGGIPVPHNTYSKSDINKFLTGDMKVDWVDLGDECALHIRKTG